MPVPTETILNNTLNNNFNDDDDDLINFNYDNLKKSQIRAALLVHRSYVFVSIGLFSVAYRSSDFRSDVVTVPTPAVLQSMINATFLDEIYEGDATVAALENKMAKMAGKEAALWVISGTQANQISLRTHLTQPPHSVLCDHRSHIYCWESGAIGVLSQALVSPIIPSNNHHLTVNDISNNIIPDGNIHFAPTKVISLENTLSGTVLPLNDVKKIRQFTLNHPNKPKMHLDGARLFDAVIAEGVSLKDYCANFDSVSLCIQKGTGAPVGSMIVGDQAFINRAKWYRKMFGGGARQPGMLAAAGLTAIDQALPKIPATQRKAKFVSDYFVNELGLKLTVPTETNMVIVDLDKAQIPPKVWKHRLFQYGVRVFEQGRLVFHNQISDQGVNALCQAVKSLVIDSKIPGLLTKLNEQL